jgi:hypothetical protein
MNKLQEKMLKTPLKIKPEEWAEKVGKQVYSFLSCL